MAWVARRSGSRRVLRHRTGFLVVAAVFAACTSTLVDYSADVHVVQPGETLYAIAWRHGLDYHQLARWNGLSNPDRIAVGQRIRLRPGASPASATAPASTPRPSAAPLPAAPALPPPRWQWPTEGPVLRAFGAAGGLANGIGIGGRPGQAIRAAAPGRVVYAGSGLNAYGQLVIIKHNDTYLSAYGHNSELVVTQGEDIAAGQVIARMGLGSERQPQLHFEIRRNGAPVDPLSHLPR
ncbi:MAG TPA: peptidoglycan DD-metalloendopeptidase family protein [Gammaproteobacteria bacterium]|jgi:lipoprotein NlpD